MQLSEWPPGLAPAMVECWPRLCGWQRLRGGSGYAGAADGTAESGRGGREKGGKGDKGGAPKGKDKGDNKGISGCGKGKMGKMGRSAPPDLWWTCMPPMLDRR